MKALRLLFVLSLVNATLFMHWMYLWYTNEKSVATSMKLAGYTSAFGALIAISLFVMLMANIKRLSFWPAVLVLLSIGIAWAEVSLYLGYLAGHLGDG